MRGLRFRMGRGLCGALFGLALGAAAGAAEGPDAKTQLEALNAEVVQAVHRGAYAEGVLAAERALALARQIWGPDHPGTLAVMNNLTSLYMGQGRYGEAEPLLREALRLRRGARAGIPTPGRLNNLAGLYTRQGRHGEAEPLLREALQLQPRGARAAPPRHAGQPEQPGRPVLEPGPLRRGRAALREALQLRREVLGRAPPRHAAEPEQPGRAVHEPGPLRRGRAALPRGAAAAPRGARARPPRHADQPEQPGRPVPAPGPLRRGRAALPRGAAARREVLGERHPDTLTSLNNLAALYTSQGRYGEAEPLLRRRWQLTPRGARAGAIPTR